MDADLVAAHVLAQPFEAAGAHRRRVHLLIAEADDDLGLIDLSTGEILDMPSGYDEFSKRAYANYDGGTETETANRELLRREMEAVGFRVNPGEWWHFDYQDWDQYRIQNVRFADIDSDGKSNG